MYTDIHHVMLTLTHAYAQTLPIGHLLPFRSTPKVGGFSPAFRPVGETTDNSLLPVPEPKESEKQESGKPSEVKGEKRSPAFTEPAAFKPPIKKSAPVDMFDMFADEEEGEKEKDLEGEHQFPIEKADEEPTEKEEVEASLPPEGSIEDSTNNPASIKSATNLLLPRFAQKSRPIVREPKEKSAHAEKRVRKEMTVEETQNEVWKVAEMLHQRHSTNTKSAGYLARCRERIERYKKAQVFVPGGTVLLDTSKFAAEVEQKRQKLKPGEDFDVPPPRPEKVIDDINEEDLESLRGVIMGFGKATEKPKRVQPKLKLTVSNVFNQDSSSEDEGEGSMVGALSASGVMSTWTHKKPSSLPK